VVSSVVSGILSIEARDMDTKLLSAPESNNTLTRFPSQMTHLVASITHGTVSSIPTVLIVLVVVVVIIGIVVVVVGAPSIIKLAFVITGSFHRTTLYYLIHQPLGYVDGFL
nr:hypothetical protein [Tanacetum cinerariifolium]